MKPGAALHWQKGGTASRPACRRRRLRNREKGAWDGAEFRGEAASWLPAAQSAQPSPADRE